MDVSNANKFWFRTKLATAAVLLSAAVLAFAVSSGFITPCNRALGQSTSCNVGDTETFTGPTVFSDSIELSDEFLVGATPAAGTANEILVSQGSAAAPEWGAASTIGLPAYVFKAADETDNNAPLQNDDDLLFAVDANSEYVMRIVLKALPLSGTEQLVVDFNEPASTEIDCGVHYWNNSITHTTEHLNESGSITMTQPLGAVTFQCLVTTVGTAGTVQLRWYGTGTNGYTLEEGSWLEYVKLN